MFPVSLGVCLLCCCQPPTPTATQAWSTWQRGQQTLLDGESDRAIALFEEALALDPHFTRCYLSLAAAWLDKGDDSRACVNLMLYVAAHPENLAARAQYAELLQRLRRLTESRLEFESLVADVQEKASALQDQLIHCHSRLMQIGAARAEEYELHLHRGIGLYLLARATEPVTESRTPPSREGLLCRAAAELTLARRARPEEARPLWYLYEVWTTLAQSHPALRCLHAAESAAPLSYLTPAESRALRHALQEHKLAPRAR